MAWTGAPDAPPTVRIAALVPSLAKGERKVAEAIAADVERAVDMTAQELADAVGVGRASVVRTAQTLGFEGYPQLRVALARERALAAPAAPVAAGSLGVVQAAVDRFARSLPHTAAALTSDVVEAFVTALDEAPRLVIAASGLSAPLGHDAAMRLTSAGRPVEFQPDPLSQHIAARQLRPGDVLFVISGSGATVGSLHAADAAREAGATVLALTAFARAPLVSRATTTLVVPPVTDSFQDELTQTSRAAFALVIEALVEAFVVRRGPRAREARAAALAVVSESLGE
ncbi:MurR/RpiR family transcriptional regulator [Demequina gelatinilytica]|uniref:MurR/RpiR family transcriptional regulator n=1 Tax=Demequina gelatinilytica TaxID=1638980 RepID=UPI0009E61E70|nr:MurR/RpiR family transcriptional regulator [Demequina gelatinilytica]